MPCVHGYSEASVETKMLIQNECDNYDSLLSTKISQECGEECKMKKDKEAIDDFLLKPLLLSSNTVKKVY